MMLVDNKAASERHYGTLTSVAESLLITRNDAGEEHSHMVAANARVTYRGRPCKLSDLTVGTHVRIAYELAGNIATTIECLRIPGTTLG